MRVLVRCHCAGLAVWTLSRQQNFRGDLGTLKLQRKRLFTRRERRCASPFERYRARNRALCRRYRLLEIGKFSCSGAHLLDEQACSWYFGDILESPVQFPGEISCPVQRTNSSRTFPNGSNGHENGTSPSETKAWCLDGSPSSDLNTLTITTKATANGLSTEDKRGVPHSSCRLSASRTRPTRSGFGAPWGLPRVATVGRPGAVIPLQFVPSTFQVARIEIAGVALLRVDSNHIFTVQHLDNICASKHRRDLSLKREML